VTKEPNLDQWFYLPGWRKSLPGKSRNVRGSTWIIVCDSSGLANSIAEQLSVAGADVRLIQDEKNQSTPPKKNYASISADTKKSELHTAIIDTTSVSDWDNYFKALDGFKPEYIIHTGL